MNREANIQTKKRMPEIKVQLMRQIEKKINRKMMNPQKTKFNHRPKLEKENIP